MAPLTEPSRPPEPRPPGVVVRGGTRFRSRVRIEVDGGGEPRILLGASQACEPVLRNRSVIQRYLEDANQRATRSGRVVLWVFVKEDGSVGNARLVEPSGDDFLDAVSVGIATRIEFHPAMIDRRPLPVWIQIPFAVARQ